MTEIKLCNGCKLCRGFPALCRFYQNEYCIAPPLEFTRLEPEDLALHKIDLFITGGDIEYEYYKLTPTEVTQLVRKRTEIFAKMCVGAQ